MCAKRFFSLPAIGFLLPGLVSGAPLEWHGLPTGMPPNSYVGPPTRITIRNDSDRTVKLFWIKYNGSPRAYGELAPGALRKQGTFSHASWLVTDMEDRPLGYFRTTHKPGTAVIPREPPDPPLREMRYTPGNRADAIAWQNELRASMFALMKMDDLAGVEAPLPLKATLVSSEDRGKFLARELVIDSTPGRRIKVFLTLPKAPVGPRPAVVAIGGHSSTRHSCHGDEGFATQLAERGYVTVSTKISQHAVSETGRTLMGERLWDLMRCVDLLVSLEEVDQKRVGCAGNSLGGEMAMWLGGMDERVAATVSAGFLTRMDQVEANHCRCWKFPGLRGLADFPEIYALAAPRALMCQNGLKEKPTWFTVQIAREALRDIEPIYADLDAQENLEFVAHAGGHVIDHPALLRFFERHLRPAE